MMKWLSSAIWVKSRVCGIQLWVFIREYVWACAVSICCLCLGSSEGLVWYSSPFHYNVHQCVIGKLVQCRKWLLPCMWHCRHSPVLNQQLYYYINSALCRCVTLTCRNSDACRNADTVVNDSKHIDVVLHSCLQAWDGAGGHIAWNPDL